MRIVCALLVPSILACTRPAVVVPSAPVPCVIPAFHIQRDCGEDTPTPDLVCIVQEFSETLLAEHQVSAALAACPEVRIRG